MLKKTIKYVDFDENEVTEDFYFNFTKAEIAELELSYANGLSTHLEKIVQSNDGGLIISTFRELISKAVGRRSEDGRRFVKSPEITSDFMQSNAFSELFMELVTNAEAAAEFVSAIVPKDMSDSLAKGITDVPLPKENPDIRERNNQPAYIREDRDPTPGELQAMTREELQEAFRRKNALRSVGE